MRLEILSPPSGEFVEVDDAKQFARLHLDIFEDDDLVESLIKSARELLESRVARCFLPTVVRETRVVPANGRIRLSRAPIIQLNSLTVDDEVITPLPPLQNLADLTGKPGQTIVVEYQAGYPDVASVPETAKLIVKMLVAHWYGKRTPTSRDAQNDVPFHVDVLLDSLRWGGSLPR